MEVLSHVGRVGGGIENLDLQSHQVKGEGFQHYVGDALGSHLIHLRGVFSPYILQPDNVLPATCLVLTRV